MRGRQLVVLLVVLALLLALVPGQAVATEPNYCKDGVPVVNDWPERYKTFVPVCDGGMFMWEHKPTDFRYVEATVMSEPEDFGRWAFVYLNEIRMINPYRDVVPFVVLSSGRTLVPIRMVTEAMGGTAEWEQSAHRVTIRLGEKYMEMTIGSPEAVANGNPVTIDQPPLLWQDRTMVPLRVITEAFGAEVTWTDEYSRVDIALPGVTCQPTYCVEL